MTADLADFATDAPAAPPTNRGEVAMSSAPPQPNAPATQNKLTQWAITGEKVYQAVSTTTKALPPGVYSVTRDNMGHLLYVNINTKVDNLMEFPDSVHDRILGEIEEFWSRAGKFADFGFLHRRGYLFYGPQGSGKTGIVNQIMARIVKAGDVVFLCQRPEFLIDGLLDFRKVEPSRRAVCVFEDIDAIVREYGEDRLLALLDGENQIDYVLNIATTNYPERLDKRLVARPRRFDRVEKIGMPNADVRRVYLASKLKLDVNDDEVTAWVNGTDGLSFAALAEAVISVKCLGNDFENTLKILRTMATGKSSSSEFETSNIGIRPK